MPRKLMPLLRRLVFLFREPCLYIDVNVRTAVRMLRIARLKSSQMMVSTERIDYELTIGNRVLDFLTSSCLSLWPLGPTLKWTPFASHSSPIRLPPHRGSFESGTISSSDRLPRFFRVYSRFGLSASESSLSTESRSRTRFCPRDDDCETLFETTRLRLCL